MLDIQIGQTIITTTPEHEFWIPGTGCVRARNLVRGSPFFTKDDQPVYIESIQQREGSFTVYNLEVERLHNYLVSELGILVHNANYRARKIAHQPPPRRLREPQLHHDLPQAPRFQQTFEDLGIDIHDPAFTRWMEGANHRQWSFEFNQEWDRFF